MLVKKSEPASAVPGRIVDSGGAKEILGVSKSFLEQHRIKGTGPKYLKLGRAVRYRECDLYEWAAQNLIETK